MFKRLIISHGSEVPAEFGPVRLAQKRKTVRIRDPQTPVEKFHLSWGDLKAVPGVDYVVCTAENPEGEYPCKIEIFNKSYEETSPGSGEYRKSALNQLVAIPEGFEVVLKTEEGDETAGAGNWIAIGANDEVYAQSPDFVEKELELVE